MRQAQVRAWGEKPTLVDLPELPAPGAGEVRIRVEATGIHRVVQARAAGKHYSANTLPHIPGIDGVGVTDRGQRCYFVSFSSGSLADYVNVPRSSLYPVPQGVDARQIAAAVNPAMSSWMALKARTTALPKNFTVLVLGASSASGRVAIPLARALGAKKVIGAARSQATLDTLGLDQAITIASNVEQTNFGDLDDVDVVLDYIYGPLTMHLFRSLHTPKPVQYVHIGGLAATEITLPGDVLRSKDITIRGSGPGSWSMEALSQALPDLLAAMQHVPEQPVKVAQLGDVEKEWEYAGPERLVFVP